MKSTGKKTIKKRICIIVVIFMIIIGLCYYIAGNIYGENDYTEGNDIGVITRRFEGFTNIIKCYYKIDIASAGGMGPIRYNMEALVVIDENESKRLKEKYDWITEQAVADKKLYNGMEIGIIDEWLYNKEFCSDTLGGSFVGEVYFSEKENCIYIIAGM